MTVLDVTALLFCLVLNQPGSCQTKGAGFPSFLATITSFVQYLLVPLALFSSGTNWMTEALLHSLESELVTAFTSLHLYVQNRHTKSRPLAHFSLLGLPTSLNAQKMSRERAEVPSRADWLTFH